MEIINYLINRPPDDENILVYLDDFGSSKKEMKDKIFQDLYFQRKLITHAYPRYFAHNIIIRFLLI